MFYKLLDIISTHTGKSVEDITPDLRFDRYLSDVDFAEMVIDIESELGIEIAEDALMQIQTVKDLWAYIKQAEQ
ncbi:MAG: hypothetical protein IKF18_02080 [Erysipelotrichaceae bacterium]|nr:hypothetical protein [Erysipelotrichaceae bacterium]